MRAEVKRLMDKCDALFRVCILLRDRNTCQFTAATLPPSELEVMHYISRSNKRTRWMPENACAGDRVLHRTMPEYEAYACYELRFPARVADVRAVEHEIFRVNAVSLQEVYDKLASWKRELENIGV